jgi:dienelactone hydrolase
MRLGNDVPSLVIHPQWDGDSLAPAVIWMHGRSVNKELDPGRYQRWVRAGIGAVSLDLPGHGERFIEAYQGPAKTLDLIAQARDEIDGVLDSMRELERFDMSRLILGGMSAGGMVTLSRLCSAHPFLGACVEGTTGNLKYLYNPPPGMPARPWPIKHDPLEVANYDPIELLDGFKPIPLLAIHNEGDAVVPIGGQRLFLDALRRHYLDTGADPKLIEMQTFTETGAPSEHAGFGRYANDAKNIQLAFIKRVMGVD